ncbi:MAG: amino acid permease [Bacteroidales bacterium]|nr:amino acid permease [Bacteroidales bacterium]
MARQHPVRSITVFDSVCIVIGITVGAGIFKAPGIVAQEFSHPGSMLLIWLAGGLFCFCGALTYAELAGKYPDIGGEYHYLSNFYRQPVGFLFAWSRMTVIQTGSIASIAYIFGDYASQFHSLGRQSSALYACAAVSILTLSNILGLKMSKTIQNLLTVSIIAGLCVLSLVSFSAPEPQPVSSEPGIEKLGAIGLALVFVLYTYGGWNEAAYTTGELQNRKKNIIYVFALSVFLLTGLYIMVNAAYLNALGLEGMKSSGVVAFNAMECLLGKQGGLVLSGLIILATLSSVNGCIFTGARSIIAIGKNHRFGFHWLGKWNRTLDTPVTALLLQGTIAVSLILFAGLGYRFRDGFETLVEYTAPVFWLFLLMIAISALSLINTGMKTNKWLYASVALIFCMMCGFMLFSSLVYTKAGALFGVLVLATGIPVYYLTRKKLPPTEREDKQQ